MRRFQRAGEPEFLASVWEGWGLEWEQRHAANASTAFNWHQIEGERVNQKLLPLLKAQTQDHCSFCDNFPVSPPSNCRSESVKMTYSPRALRWSFSKTV